MELEEFERWAMPLDEGIARVVADDLAKLLGTTQVATVPLPPGFMPTYQVAMDVQRFESIPGQGVVIEAVWVVRKTTGGEPRMGRTVASESAGGDGFEAFAAAHSRALAKVSDIAAAIRGGGDETLAAQPRAHRCEREGGSGRWTTGQQLHGHG